MKWTDLGEAEAGPEERFVPQQPGQGAPVAGLEHQEGSVQLVLVVHALAEVAHDVLVAAGQEEEEGGTEGRESVCTTMQELK